MVEDFLIETKAVPQGAAFVFGQGMQMDAGPFLPSRETAIAAFKTCSFKGMP